MREVAIEEYLHNSVIDAGGDTEKHVSPGRRGVPDRLVTWPWAFIGGCDLEAELHLVETKAPTGRLRDAQKRYIEAKRKMGITVHVLHTKDAVDAYVDRYRRT